MRVVDWYYFDRVDSAMSEEEKQEYLEKAVKAREKGNKAERLQSRRHREERVQMKSMMKYLFGKVGKQNTCFFLLRLLFLLL